MGFFYSESGSRKHHASAQREMPVATLRELKCRVCPLDKLAQKLGSPKLGATGSARPSVYVLGGGRSEEGDQKGSHFAGEAGRLLQASIPSWAEASIRYGSVVRCYSMEQREPTPVEVTCCSGWLEEDIEATKPQVIIGVGPVPLSWALKTSATYVWRGRLLPIKVGSHVCWFYNIYHPDQIIAKRRGFATEWDSLLRLDLENIFGKLKRDTLPTPEVVSSGIFNGIEQIEGGDVGDIDRLVKGLRRLLAAPRVGFDIETSTLRPYAKDSLLLSAAVSDGEYTLSFAVDHPRGWPDHLRRRVRQELTQFLADAGTKVCHNGAFEQEWVAEKLSPLLLRRTAWADTMAQCHALDERIGAKSLDDLTQMHFGFSLKAQSNIDRKNMLAASVPDLLRYNGGDAKWTLKVYAKQAVPLREAPGLLREYHRLVRTAPTTVFSQIKGVPVDFPYARKLRKEFDDQVVMLERQLRATPEVQKFSQRFGAFSHSSTDHVTKLLRDICKREEGRTSTGYSTDEGVLNAIPKSAVPSATIILELRGLSKLVSTYLVPIIDRKVVYADGKMHTNYNTMVTDTGRTSSDDPNLQNFPARKFKQVRGVFRAPPGMKIVSLDYGQIEARVIAMASEDPVLVQAMWTDYDIHKHWALYLAKVHPDSLDRIAEDFEVDRDDDAKLIKTLRGEMKNKWVFPQFFGSHYKSCAAALHVPEQVAEKMAKIFWGEFSGVKRWQDKLINNYEKLGYVETLTGRRRRMPLSKNQIINSPIQGTASDIVVDAWNRLSERADRESRDVLQPVMNIHDDLTFLLYNSPEQLDDDLSDIVEEMCTPTFDFINVPLLVEASMGDSWDAKKEIGVFRSDRDFGFGSPAACEVPPSQVRRSGGTR